MNTEKFTTKADQYEQFRPNYPEAFLALLAEEGSVADIGAGTGILTKQLLDANYNVYAVEPNEAMRAKLTANVSAYKRAHVVAAPAEETGLAEQSVDFITVAQAFHWFDEVAFRLECQRILRPDGIVYLLWNSRIADDTLVHESEAICQRYCPQFAGFSGGLEQEVDFSNFFRDGQYEETVIPHPLSYTLDAFIGRNLSASYAPNETDEQYESFVAALTDLFKRYEVNGRITLANETRCYYGRV